LNAAEVKPKKEKEPSSFSVANPARVIPSQVRFLSPLPDQRYTPVSLRTESIGIVMLVDNDPSAAEEVSKLERVSIGQGEEESVPEPFEWSPDSM
jgi:26S proteasome regulatory subunit N2